MDFQDELEVMCKRYAAKYGGTKEGLERGFEALVVHLSAADGTYLSQLGAADLMAADLSDYIFRHNDGGVDGYLEDDTNRLALVIQAQYRHRKGGIDHQKLEAFLNLSNVLFSPKKQAFIENLDPRLQPSLEGLEHLVDDGWSCVLRYATNRPTDSRSQDLVDATNARLESMDLAVTCEIIGQTELKAIWREVTTGLAAVTASFKLQAKTFVQMTSPRQTLVGVVTGNQLAALFKTHRNQLFAQNVRLPMLSSTRVNPEIERTARDAPEDFFFFNNGVSAVCSSYIEAGGEVLAEDFQIINGAQTVGTLGKLSPLSEKVRVLFRLTTVSADDSTFRDEVTRTNNTQNEVVPWDFRANDPIQRFLEGELKSFSGNGPVPAFWYKRKRGLDASGRLGRALEPEYLGKLRHAFLFGPITSYKEPKRLALITPDLGLYHEAFGINGKVPAVWPKSELETAMLAYALDALIIRKTDEYRKSAPPHAYSRWLRRLSRFVVGLFGEVMRSTPTLGLKPHLLLAMTSEEFATAVDPVLRSAMDKINDEYNRIKEDRVQPEYDIGRDEKRFQALVESVRAAVTA